MIVLKGNSGCSLQLLYDGARRYVRKVSSSQSYNSRLAIQAQKLRSIRSRDSGVTAPAVYSDGFTTNKLYYYDMEFVDAMKLCDFVNTVSVADSIEVISVILDWCELNWKDSFGCDGVYLTPALKMKLSSLECSDSYGLTATDLPHVYARSGRNHGDLTFENVLITHDKEIYFIDPMDSYLHSPIADLSKIYADLWFMWSASSTGSLVNPGVYESLRRTVLNNGLFSRYSDVIPHLAKIDILRAVPYLTGEREYVITDVVKQVRFHDVR